MPGAPLHAYSGMLTASPFGSFAGFTGAIHPVLGIVFYTPAPLLDSARFIRNIHKPAMKQALWFVLLTHHQKTVPKHFERGAAERYGYFERAESTRRIKLARYHHDVELVESGKSKREMTGMLPKITISGQATEVLIGILRYVWPFPVSRDAKNEQHITMAKMSREIEAWTDDEKQAALKLLAERYSEIVAERLARHPKMQERYMAAAASQLA